MARLIPKVAIEEIEVKPERDTARYLVDLLPDDCIIYHSYPWLKKDRNDRGNTVLKEGETDFVVIFPKKGLLVVEVKGGDIDYDANLRQWNRVIKTNTGTRLKGINDPFEQVRRNTHYLEGAIKLRGYPGSEKLPFAYGYLVVFPDCEYTGFLPPGADGSLVISASDLPRVDQKIGRALDYWSRKQVPVPLSDDDINRVQQAISPAFNLLPVLFRKVDGQEEKLFRLTADQLNLLGFLGDRHRACIVGVAGSGKTMLAQARAEKFADQGKSVLFVCFNKNLAQWISDSIADQYKDLITVKHFHGLCAEIVSKSGQVFSPPKQGANEFWKEQAPDMLMDAIDMVERTFDAVIVDEGQDFYPNWWLPLEAINSNGDEGAMFVFYDPRQNLYVNQKSSLPALGDPFVLPVNCRNTKLIAKKCGEILELDIPTRDDAPQGEEPKIQSLDLAFDIKKRVEATINEWMVKGKLKPSQIAILCPVRKENSSLQNTNAIEGKQLTDDLTSWKNDKGILFSTVKGFKGLEADAVIIIDTPSEEGSAHFAQSDYYVACSRAKHLLVVLHKEE